MKGAGLYIAGSSALIEDNVIRGNRAESGGGLYVGLASGLEVVGNDIEHNTATWGGGMALWTSEDILVENNVFRGNKATREGGAMGTVNYSYPLISQNLFVDNEAVESAGALSVSAPIGVQGATLVNNTITGNRAPRGSAIVSTGDWMAVNNIISGRSDAELMLCEGGYPARMFNNDVYNATGARFRWCSDNTGIAGNISVDPRLTADFALSPGSPAIDAGGDNPLLPLVGPTDANGAPRVVDGNGDGVAAVDLGAYEWPGAGVPAFTPAPASYHSLPPARVLDSRVGLGLAGSLGPGATATLQVAGRGGVPATGVSAVVLNVTVTQPTALSYLTAWPAGEPRPHASNLNFVTNQTVPNLVVVKVGAGGKVNLFNSAGGTHVVGDVAGWYGPHVVAPGASYTPVPPARLLDTRTGTGALPVKLQTAHSVDLQVTGRGGVPGSGVSAVVLNVTVTEADAESYLTVYPTGDGRPHVSNLNYRAGDTVANLVVVKLGRDGKVTLYNSAGTTHLIADVAGWYGTPTSGAEGTFNPLVPTRVLDTRTGLGAPAARLGPGATVSLQVTGRAGIPAGAVGAVVLNVTVTEPTSVSWLTVWPGGSSRPLASNLNYRPAQTVPNLVVVQVGTNGKVNLSNANGTAHVIADVAGWYG